MRAAGVLLVVGAINTLLAQTPIQVDVDLVRVPCDVTDRNGAVVSNLRPEEFSIIADGEPQLIRYVWREFDLPLRIGLICDVSGSQSAFVRRHKQTVAQFLSDILTEKDRAFLVAIASQQRLVVDLTSSAESLSQGLSRLGSDANPILGEPCEGTSGGVKHSSVARRRGWPCGGTALWNGVYFSAKSRLKQMEGRKALLILTDGLDTGSDHTLMDGLEACQSADTMVYGILYTENPYLPALINPMTAPLALSMLKAQIAKGKRDVNRIAMETGGASFDGRHVPLREIFARIEQDLREQYVLGFTPAIHTAGVHKIKVTVTRPGLQVRARQWYSR